MGIPRPPPRIVIKHHTWRAGPQESRASQKSMIQIMVSEEGTGVGFKDAQQPLTCADKLSC